MSPTSPLGSRSSWVLDGALAGLLQSAGPIAAIGASVLLEGQRLDLGELVVYALVLSLSTAYAVALALPLRELATRTWDRARIVALAAGPLVGGAGCWLVVVLVRAIGTGSTSSMVPDWTVSEFFVALGALIVGPPWIAYLAVRARGRRGFGVVLASVIWAVALGVIAAAIDHAQRRL